MSSGDWKPLLNDKRRCRIFTCHNSGLCCADCAKENCKKRCLNAPERCGQVIQRETKEKDVEQQKAKDSAAKEHFYSERDDAWEARAYTKKRRL